MEIKRAARTVIYDENNLFALIEVRNGEYYKIPGGGIEIGETPVEAAIREAREESGCDVKIIQEISQNQFEDKSKKIIHHSVCFLAKKTSDSFRTSFDNWEQQNSMKLIWVGMEQAVELFKQAKPADYVSKEINQRDFGFILKAKEILNY